MSHVSPATYRKAWRRWSRAVLTTVLLIAISIVGMNVLIDPYEVYRWIPYRNGFTPNEWDNKLAHLRTHPNQAQILLLGSSRMGLYDPRWFSSDPDKQDAYNLSKLAARPSDIVPLLEALARHELIPREIWFGIDLYPFLESPAPRGPAHYTPPFITGKSEGHFLSRYLFQPAFIPAFMRIKQSLSATPELVFDYAYGFYRAPGLVHKRNANPQVFDKKEFGKTGISLVNTPFNTEEIEALRAIAAWSRTHQVPIHAFIHPHHPLIQEQAGKAHLKELDGLVQQYFGPAPNLMHYLDRRGNSVFLDKKHYTPDIAKEINLLLMSPPS
jgi:hypothetical protein